MLFIVFACSGDLFFGFSCFMYPESDLRFICCFSTSSKAILPSCTFLKILFGLLNLIKLTEGIFESLKS